MDDLAQIVLGYVQPNTNYKGVYKMTNQIFEFWAQKAGLQTGKSIFDSGGAYGYNSDRALPGAEVTVDLYDGEFEGATISTVHLLSEYADPTNDLAQAVDKLFVWFGKFAVELPWVSVMEKFVDWLGLVLEHTVIVELDESDTKQNLGYSVAAWDGNEVEGRAIVLIPTLERMQRTTMEFLDQTGYVGDYGKKEAGKFPCQALVEIRYYEGCRNSEYLTWKGAINTYNSESDLSRTMQFGIMTLNGQVIVLMQLHNGRDVRSGYTRPYAALAGEYYRLMAPLVDFWCRNCDGNFYSQYDLEDAYSESEFSFAWKWEKGVTPTDIEEGFVSVDARKILLRCPKCGEFSLRAYS